MTVVTRLFSRCVGPFGCIWQGLWEQEDKPLPRTMRAEESVATFVVYLQKSNLGFRQKHFFFFFYSGRKRKCFLLRK